VPGKPAWVIGADFTFSDKRSVNQDLIRHSYQPPVL
jgi:hypothetical protein